MEIKEFNIPEHVLDDVLNKTTFTPDFSYNFAPTTCYGSPELKAKTKFKVVDSPMVCHVLYGAGTTPSYYFPDFAPLLDYIEGNILFIFRMKINLTFQTDRDKDSCGIIHVDHKSDKLYSVVIYLEDSDGDTLFFNDDGEVVKRITPKKGKGVIFKSNAWHCGQNPINTKTRAVLNIVLGFE